MHSGELTSVTNYHSDLIMNANLDTNWIQSAKHNVINFMLISISYFIGHHYRFQQTCLVLFLTNLSPLNFKTLFPRIELFGIISIYFVVVVQFSCCSFLLRQFINIHDMLSAVHCMINS